MIVYVAAVVYCATASLGIVAWIKGRRFGRWHHIFYFGCVVSNVAAVVADGMGIVLAPLLILALMPFTRGGSDVHRRLGYAGLITWGIIFFVR